MPAYNFKKQFAHLVESGAKRCTIRPIRKRPTRPGDTLYLYTGMRTTSCRKLLQTTCTAVTPLQIEDGTVIKHTEKGLAVVMNDETVEQLARVDGFESTADFYQFFKDQYGLPCDNMELLEW